MARYEEVAKEFNEACTSLRNHLSVSSRFIVEIDLKYYIVMSDQERNFEVEEIEMI
jgi:hypothetical protein